MFTRNAHYFVNLAHIIYSSLINSSQILKTIQPFSNGYIIKSQYIHIIEYYSKTNKQKGIIDTGKIWMNLKRIMVSKKIQSQKIIYYMVLFM